MAKKLLEELASAAKSGNNIQKPSSTVQDYTTGVNKIKTSGSGSTNNLNGGKSASGSPSSGSGNAGGYYTSVTTTKKNPYDNPAYEASTGLYGVSDATKQKMEGYGEYKPSQAVTDAMSYLDSLKQNAPGQYTDPYADRLNDLYNQITSRPGFSYDLNGDMLYKQYAQQYQQMGQQAMQDTMGQAAALTGGYGSSYASTAGNQAYQGYLQQLNERVPELYQLAMQKYQMEGDQLAQQYGLTQDMSESDYGRYMDAINRYYTDLGLATDAYNAERNFDYGAYGDARDYWTQMAQMEMQNAENQRNYAYSTVMQMLQNGIKPSDAMLGAAGLSEYDVWQMLNNGGKSTTMAYVPGATTSPAYSSSASTSPTSSASKSDIQSILGGTKTSSGSSSYPLSESELLGMWFNGEIDQQQYQAELEKLKRS